jgi:hypothetical protein
MKIYSVHLNRDDQRFESLIHSLFIAESFSWKAFLLGPVWLLSRGLLRAFALWFIFATFACVMLAFGYIGLPSTILLYLISALFLGVEASTLESAMLARQNCPVVDYCAGLTIADAERSFFSRRRDDGASVKFVRTSAIAETQGADIGIFPESEI